MESNPAIQPRMLKDFLHDQTLTFHRRRRSTFAVFFHAAVTSPSLLRRTISRRLSKSKITRKTRSASPEIAMARTTSSVTVKDILRWRSFRNLVEEEVSAPVPSNFASPSRCTATTTATTTPRSSWCDSDFTVGDSPVWCRGLSSDVEVGGEKNFRINVAGGDGVRGASGATRDPKDQLSDEGEQYSPISILDFQLQEEDTEIFSSFNQTLSNIERRKFMLKQKIQEFENLVKTDGYLLNRSTELDEVEAFKVEEKAIQLMNMVKETSLIEECEADVQYLLLDFFRDEMIMDKESRNNGQLESKMLRTANAWVRGVDDGSLEWEMEGTRDVCIRDMEKRQRWSNFDEDREEICIDIAGMVFNHLLDELSTDFLNL